MRGWCVGSDPRDQLRVERRVSIATADDAADSFPLESVWLREDRTDRERPCRLGLEIGQREKKAHPFLDLVLGDLDDSGETVAENIPVTIAYPQNASAVGNGRGLIRPLDDVARAKRFRGVVGGAPPRPLDEGPRAKSSRGVVGGRRPRGKTFVLPPVFFCGFARAGRQPPPADRRDDEIQIEVESEQLRRERRIPFDYQRI